MNGAEPHIEIFKPFEEAIELTKQILFRPFDFGKWCVIGFAAFLAGGANFGLGFRLPLKAGNWSIHSSSYTSSTGPFMHGGHVQWWLIALFAVIFLVVLAIVVVLSWVRARGAFIFTDCVVRNRAAIVEPWNEFRREGNSLFLFSWLVALAFLSIVALASLAFVLPLLLTRNHGTSANFAPIAGLVLFCTIIFFAAVAWALVYHFVVPIMYRRRCRALAAVQDSASLIITYPAPIILYFLFLVAVAIVCALVGCVTVCVTCCIAALPYVGTVILLPIFVLLRAYVLFFLRQFGADYDVWNAVPPSAPPSPPVTPPLPA